MAERSGRTAPWHALAERGDRLGISILVAVYRLLGRHACLVVMAPVVFYFFLTAGPRRRASLEYLRRVWKVTGRTPAPGQWESLKHFFSFAASVVDKFGAWIGDTNRGDVDGIENPLFWQMRDDPRGALIISAHVGSIDIVRAIASRDQKRPVNVVVHTPNAQRYNRLIERYAPASQVRLLQAAKFDLGAAMQLSAAVNRGEWAVMMADRVSIRHEERAIDMTFLGAPIRLPEGPFTFAAILECPVYLLLCVKDRGRHRVRIALLRDAEPGRRADRAARVRDLALRYAAALEEVVRETPYQWFNFYDYWARPADAAA